MGVSYTESAVCLDIDGPYLGEYVVRCATDACGYVGEQHVFFCQLIQYLTITYHPVPLERMYARMGLHLKRYNVRRTLFMKILILWAYSRLPAPLHVARFFPASATLMRAQQNS